jgi:hypothetical protein
MIIKEVTKMSYKLGVKTPGDTEFVSNALCFETEREAEEYGIDLFSRWMVVKETQVIPSNEPVNYRFINGRAERIPD